MGCSVKCGGHSLRVGSFLGLEVLKEGEGCFKVIMVRRGYPCQAGSEVKGSLVTGGVSRDGVPHRRHQLCEKHHWRFLFFMKSTSEILKVIWSLSNVSEGL